MALYKCAYYYAASLKAIRAIATNVTVAWSVHLNVCMLSVTLVHLLKPLDGMRCHLAGHNVLDRGLWSPRKGDIGGQNSDRSDAAYRRITLALIIILIIIIIIIITTERTS